jgi:RND family efflux transporter MFP subunit
MVLRVCRGILADPHDAQDAFQATFLVLVRRARSLWVRDSLGPWLHQVAYRTASCLRSAIARRRRLERRAAGAIREDRPGVGDELIRVIHEELGRLPEPYRAPAVLCDLEGASHERAARHLGWPIGTVKSRLTRAREILRDRLRRRGFAPDLGLAAMLRPRAFDVLISPALVESTARAAVTFSASRAVVPGSVASLAQEVLRAMSITRWWKLAPIAAAVVATASGVGSLAQAPAPRPGAATRQQPARAADLPSVEVRPGPLRLAAVQRGVVEATRRDDVLNTVEGTTTIIWILPEQTEVKKGDKVCELDSATLRDGLKNQKINIAQAEANYQNARLDREVAETALHESVEGTLKAEEKALTGAITESRTAIQGAEARLERTRRARQQLNGIATRRRGDPTPADVAAELEIDDRLDDAGRLLAREKAALGLAETRLEVLQKYTVSRTLKEKTADIERKRSAELARRAALELEKDRERKLEREIRDCVLTAPSDGVVILANDPSRGPATRGVLIEEGATVRERQKILTVVDVDAPMQVNARVGEPLVDQVRLGVRARIKVDAFPGVELKGTVQAVAPRPDPNAFFGAAEKVYPTRVLIQDGPRGLRPGMTADVEIPIVELDGVLAVPHGAVLHFDGKDNVAVKTPGGFEWREVTLGAAGDKAVEVKTGLREGESVILDPASLMSEDERRARLGQPGGPNAPRRAGRPAPRGR